VFHSLLDQGIALAPSAFEIAFLFSRTRAATSIVWPRDCARRRRAPRKQSWHWRREPSKALQLGFLALLLISAVMILWWMFEHTR